MIIVGTSALTRTDSLAILQIINDICKTCNLFKKDWNGLNILHHAAARVGALDIGFVPKAHGAMNTSSMLEAAKSGKLKALYLLGADELDVTQLENCFVIYQGHHGDKSAHIADVILPGSAYNEKNGIYVNLEGRVQMAYRATFAPGDAREDWSILCALSQYCNHMLPFNTHEQLRRHLYESYPHLRIINNVKTTFVDSIDFTSTNKTNCINIENTVFAPAVDNFYMTDVIGRASKTMATCTSEFILKNKPKTGTNK